MTTPFGSEAVVIVSGCGVVVIVIVKGFCTTSAGNDASCNLNIGVVGPRTVGVPVIVPVVASKKRPAGRGGEPPARLQA